MVSAPTKIPFFKMNGCGNDFVIIDSRNENSYLAAKINSTVAQKICERHNGIGCDELLILKKPTVVGAAAFMEVWNADGTRVSICGNGARCAAKLLMDEKTSNEITIQTMSGLINCHRSHENTALISITLDTVKLNWNDIPLSIPCSDTIKVALHPALDNVQALPLHFSAVNVGNPHAVFFIGDTSLLDQTFLVEAGPRIENHPLFPERVNVSLALVRSKTLISALVWERGSGLTRSCGTAACACAIAGVRLGLTEKIVTVSMPGGQLLVECICVSEKWKVVLSGHVELEYEGFLEDDYLEP